MITSIIKSSTYRPLIYALLSTVFFTAMNLILRCLTDFHAFQLVFFRAVGSLVLAMACLKYQNIPLLGSRRKILFLRGIIGCLTLTLFFFSLNYLSIGIAVSLRYTSPVFSTIFAVLLLKEKIYKPQWLCFLVAFLGVFLIKGFDGQMSTIGLLLVGASSLSGGLIYVLIHKIGKEEHPLVIINYFMMTATLIGGIASIFVWKTPDSILEWLLLVSIGIVGFVGQIFMTKAFQEGEANVVVPVKYIEVIFTLILSIFIFSDVYAIWSIVGTLLVVGSLIINVLYKSYRKRKEKVLVG